MKRLFLPLAASLIANLSAAEVPKIFAGLLDKDVPVRGQIGVVMPPDAIDKYVAMVEKAAHADPEWFKEHSAKAKPGAPLPYDKKLGLSEEDYANYLKLWAQREFKPQQDVVLTLHQSGTDQWTINGMNGAETLSTLRYSSKDDTFHSPNGEMKRLEDINADPESILGAWTGKEWKFEEETTLGRTKENIAIGQFADKKYGLVVYRVQEITPGGSRSLDKSLVIRFPLGKAGQIPEATANPASGAPRGVYDGAGPATPPPAKPTTPPKKK